MSIGMWSYAAFHLVSSRWRILFRLGVILGLFFFAMAIGLLTARGMLDSNMILAATVAPLGVLVLYKLGRFEYGILTIMLSAGVIRFAIPATEWSVIVTSLMVSMALVGVWMVQLLLLDKKIELKPSPINKPLLMFVIVSIVAYVWSNLFRDPLVFIWRSFPIVQLAALTVNILLPILALLVSNKIEELKWLRWLTGIMIGLGAVAIIAHEFGLAMLTHEGGTGGPLLAIHTRGLFATWVGVLAYALALFDEDLSLWKRGLLLILLAAWLHWNFVVGILWVSGWLPLAVACVAITFMRSKKLFIVATLVGLIYLGMRFDYYWQRTVVANEEEGSGTGRVELWERNLQHIVKHPLFGMGPAGYAVYNMTYHPEDARSTHNNYFDVAAQTGVIGLAAFLWLFATLIRVGSKTGRALAGRRNFEEAFANATLGGCIGVVVAMMLGDWVLPFAYNQGIAGFDNASYTWVFLGGMVSLYHIVKARDDRSQDALMT